MLNYDKIERKQIADGCEPAGDLQIIRRRNDMISGKQRNYLKKLAHELEPTVYIGKSGLTENIKKEMINGFESRELIKVKIQEGCPLNPKETANQLADELKAEFVQAIGRKFVLYRESKDHKKIELPRA